MTSANTAYLGEFLARALKLDIVLKETDRLKSLVACNDVIFQIFFV